MALDGSGMIIQHFEKGRSEREAGGAFLGIQTDAPGGPGVRGGPGTYSDDSSETGSQGKGMRMHFPGRPAIITVFAGLFILAAIFVFLHTDLLRHISIYTLCGIGAGICAVILALYILEEHRGNRKDPLEVRQKEIPKEHKEKPVVSEAPNDMTIMSGAVNDDLGTEEWIDAPEQDFHDDLPVTELLSSYRPVHGPEDRWLLPTSENLAKIHLTGEDILIGKNQQYADIIIDSPAVSRIHARLRFRAGRYFIGDLSSRNGTTVNGDAVCGEEERVLSEGDIITFADVSYIFSTTEKGADCESSG